MSAPVRANEATLLEVDLAARRVWVADREVTLTHSEYELLAALARDPAVAHSRDQLLRVIGWRGEGFDTRTVDAHLSRLCKKVGRRFIVNVPRFGYRLGESVVVRGDTKEQERLMGIACPQCGAVLRLQLANAVEMVGAEFVDP